MMLWQPPLPEKYHLLSDDDIAAAIEARRAALGNDLLILGHHYQRDDVVEHADFRGDSLKLSQLAAQQADAKFIVFCGVHFMAESADILSADEQVVCLPNLQAGCAMAEMADEIDVAAALDEMRDLTGATVVPISYVNSTAAIKARTARGGGACCTSSNVRNVFEWALRSEADGGAGAEKIFCIPDQHLGRNTAVAMGYSLDDVAVYDPHRPHGGLSADDA